MEKLQEETVKNILFSADNYGVPNTTQKEWQNESYRCCNVAVVRLRLDAQSLDH
jgi:hypothetical protein